jgi:hypothetical protein
MAILTAAVIVVGVLCLIDLLLTFGVIRRLREHEEMISKSGPAAMPPAIGLLPSEHAAEFTAVTAGGDLLNGAPGLRMAAFFSAMCPVCPERVEPFLGYLGGHQIAPHSVLAVVVAPGGDPPPYLDRLAAAARICLEQEDGELAKAFKVQGFPAFCLLDGDGAVVASGYDPANLPAPASGP